MSFHGWNDTPKPCVVCGKAEAVPVTTEVAGEVGGKRGVVCLRCVLGLEEWRKRNRAAIREMFGEDPDPTPPEELHALRSRRPSRGRAR